MPTDRRVYAESKIVQIAATRYMDEVSGGTFLIGLDAGGNVWVCDLKLDEGWRLRIAHDAEREEP